MYKVPSARRRLKYVERLNLVPILDGIFILIFYLLLSTQFLKIFEIGSDLPILTKIAPPEDEKIPLNLTMKIDKKNISFFIEMNPTPIKIFARRDLTAVHNYLVEVKDHYPKEDTVIIEPDDKVFYSSLVKVMDAIRYYNGEDKAAGPLFKKIVYGNLAVADELQELPLEE